MGIHAPFSLTLFMFLWAMLLLQRAACGSVSRCEADKLASCITKNMINPHMLFMEGSTELDVINSCNWRKRKFTLFETLGIPGPTPNIISGNLPELVEKGIVVTFKQWTQKYGSVVGFYNGRVPMVLIKDLDAIKQIQIAKFKDCSSRGITSMLSAHHPFRKLHIFNASGQKWRTIRGVCTRSYNSNHLKKMSHLLERCTDEFLEVLETTCTQDESIDTLAICKTFAANTMLRTGFSFRMDEQDKTGWEVRDYVTQLALRNIAVFQEGFLHWLSNCFPEFTLVIQLVLRMIESVQKPAVRKLQDAIAPIIYARKWDSSEHKKRDLLQSLIDAMDSNCGGPNAAGVPNGTDEGKTTPPKQSFLSPVEVESNVSLVLTAGTVNLSKYSSWLLYLLARHQNVQKKVREEIKTILRNGGAINYDAVPKMQYLEQVFLESMRTQSSPSGFVTRLVEKELDAGCVKIPEGVSIVIPTYLLHHDPELWQDPGSFDPERFRSETFEPEDAGAYQPFGAGPRNCFAMAFSKKVIMLLAAKVVAKYRLVLTRADHEADLTDDDMEDLLVLGHVKRGLYAKFEKY